QYYYHYFYTEQPDLNWRNPAVRDAMFDVTRWWYKRGVAGFRLDAVDTLFEDPSLRDNPHHPAVRPGDRPQRTRRTQHETGRVSGDLDPQRDAQRQVKLPTPKGCGISGWAE